MLYLTTPGRETLLNSPQIWFLVSFNMFKITRVAKLLRAGAAWMLGHPYYSYYILLPLKLTNSIEPEPKGSSLHAPEPAWGSGFIFIAN